MWEVLIVYMWTVCKLILCYCNTIRGLLVVLHITNCIQNNSLFLKNNLKPVLHYFPKFSEQTPVTVWHFCIPPNDWCVRKVLFQQYGYEAKSRAILTCKATLCSLFMWTWMIFVSKLGSDGWQQPSGFQTYRYW